MTAMTMARSLMELWNRHEYLSLQRKKQSLGGPMVMGVAEAIVKGMAHTLIKCRMQDSIAMSIVHPKTIMSAAPPPVKPKRSRKKMKFATVMIENITEEMV